MKRKRARMASMAMLCAGVVASGVLFAASVVRSGIETRYVTQVDSCEIQMSTVPAGFVLCFR